MTIRCECAHCGASLKVKDKLGGTEGKCPTCHEKIQIPDASSSDGSEDLILGGDEEKPSRSDAAKKTTEEAEEDAIFGDDFFTLKEEPKRPRYVPPEISDDEDEESAPRRKQKQKPAAAESTTGAEVEAESRDNAASIASSLLSKTGKRNQPEDFKDPSVPEKIEYDYSEIKYLLLQRVLPAVGAAFIVFFLAYWMFADMMASGVKLPELASLTGQVTSNGEGVEASLLFLPIAGSSGEGGTSGSSSYAFSTAEGNYEVFYNEDVEGLAIGKHEVLISVGPARFEREITIEAGSQVIDFELAE